MGSARNDWFQLDHVQLVTARLSSAPLNRYRLKLAVLVSAAMGLVRFGLWSPCLGFSASFVSLGLAEFGTDRLRWIASAELKFILMRELGSC